MLSENQNNFHWKNKLDDVECLQGEMLADKNATWEKLHARINEKPRRKGFVWYWVAAACFLLIVIIPAITLNKKQDEIVKNTPKQIELKKETIPENSTVKENEIAKSLTVVNEKKNTIKATTQSQVIKPITNYVTQTQEPVDANTNDKNTIEQEPVVAAATLIDTTTSLAIVPLKEKAKFKVVHINELGDPVEVSTDMAYTADLHAFQLKLATQEVYKNPSVASNKKSIGILKQKNSPN